MANSYRTSVLIFCVVGAGSVTLVAAADHELAFDCDETFAPDVDAAGLAKRFGAEHITTADIYVGEGTYESGSVLYADDAKNRVEILWKNAQKQESPRVVRIRGIESLWRTIHGLSLGSDLRTVERINGVPFQLAGFAWDYGGTVTSWSGGLLEGTNGRCRTLVRLAPELHDDDPAWSSWYEQVIGDREFPSNHPAMQELDPKIYSIELSY